MDPVAKAPYPVFDEPQKMRAVSIPKENRLASVAPQHDVVQSPRIMNSRFASHASYLPRTSRQYQYFKSLTPNLLEEVAEVGMASIVVVYNQNAYTHTDLPKRRPGASMAAQLPRIASLNHRSILQNIQSPTPTLPCCDGPWPKDPTSKLQKPDPKLWSNRFSRGTVSISYVIL